MLITPASTSNLPKRTFLLDGDLDETSWASFALPLMAEDAKRKNKLITILIASPGGSVFDTTSICNVIQNLKTPTNLIILSYAYSMAALLVMAAKNNPYIKIYAYPFSSFLLHGGSLQLSGTSSQVKDFQRFSDDYEKLMKEFMLENSNLTEEDYEKIERKETYYTASEMLENGFIDEIVPHGANIFRLPAPITPQEF